MRPTTVKRITSCAELLNRYTPISLDEQEVVDGLEVEIHGDVPNFQYQRAIGRTWSGEERSKRAYMLEYKVPREREEYVQNLIYTPEGVGWFEGAVYEKFSLYDPYRYVQTLSRRLDLPKAALLRSATEFSALVNLFKKPDLRRIEVLPKGTVVEAGSRLFTYGDWVLKCLANLTSVPLVPPLIIPEFLMDYSYIRRDLELLGIELKVIREPVLIQNALVAREGRPFLCWTSDEVNAYRNAFNIKPIQPRPSSIIYLSRSGAKSEAVEMGQRSYPSDLIASVIQKIGGKVVLTSQTAYEDYQMLASEAETVIADHGAAMCNLLLWNTKNVIELFTDKWWDEAFLFLGKALGVKNYVLLNIDNFEASEFQKTLRHLTANFADTDKVARNKDICTFT